MAQIQRLRGKMAGFEDGGGRQGPGLLGPYWLFKHFSFYLESSGKPLKDFKQGGGVVRSAFWKDLFGGHGENG